VPEIVRLEKNPGEPLIALTTTRPGDPIGTIGIPSRDHINAQTASSLMTTDMRFAIEAGRGVPKIEMILGNVLPWQRNEIINRMEGDWILFIDDDMVWRPDTVARLVATQQENDFDIVGALCFRRAFPFQPTMYMREQPDEGLYNFREKWAEGEIVEVDATGMAFCLIHKRVFEMLIEGPIPPFEDRRRIGGPPPNFFHWYGSMGEDLRFCQEAKAKGARIFVDTSIEVGHISEVTIGRDDFLSALARRDTASFLERKRLNDEMGLSTMSPSEARERLGWQ
jgi:Glycosyl transferase family 2